MEEVLHGSPESSLAPDRAVPDSSTPLEAAGTVGAARSTFSGPEVGDKHREIGYLPEAGGVEDSLEVADLAARAADVAGAAVAHAAQVKGSR